MKKNNLETRLINKNLDLDFVLSISLLILGLTSNIFGLVMSAIDVNTLSNGLANVWSTSLCLILQVAVNIFCLMTKSYRLQAILLLVICGNFMFPLILFASEKGLDGNFVNYLFIAPIAYGISISKRRYVFLPILALLEYLIIFYHLGQNLPTLVYRMISFSISYTSIFCLANMFANSARSYYKKALNLSIKDELTGLYNRRKFNEDIKNENYRFGAMIDIDNFSICNNTFGHQTGDFILKTLAKIFLSYVCDEFKIYRYGGEEFFILSRFDRKNLEKILNNIQHEFFSVTDQTISIGVAEALDFSSSQEVIKKADENMYFVKENGKNNISFDGITLAKS